VTVRATDDSRDTNVILDVITTMRVGRSTSVRSDEARQGRLMINPFIYAEEACGFDRIEDLEEARPSQYFTREPTRFSVEPVTRNASIMSISESGSEIMIASGSRNARNARIGQAAATRRGHICQPVYRSTTALHIDTPKPGAAEWQVGCFTHDAPAIPADLGRSRSC